MINLLNDEELPPGVRYPAALRRLVARGLQNLEPWYVFDASQARERMHGLGRRFPTRTLLPFARREDNDDVACFDSQMPDEVVIVHDFSSQGWEQREVLPSFYSWVRKAVDDMIEFDSMED